MRALLNLLPRLSQTRRTLRQCRALPAVQPASGRAPALWVSLTNREAQGRLATLQRVDTDGTKATSDAPRRCRAQLLLECSSSCGCPANALALVLVLAGDSHLKERAPEPQAHTESVLRTLARPW